MKMRRSAFSSLVVAQLHKIYGHDPKEQRRYGPLICVGAEKRLLK
jgi:hypothetical protein